MRPILWDDGTRYDDANAHWGDGGSWVCPKGLFDLPALFQDDQKTTLQKPRLLP